MIGASPMEKQPTLKSPSEAGQRGTLRSPGLDGVGLTPGLEGPISEKIDQRNIEVLLR